jgi:hypothetical protein
VCVVACVEKARPSYPWGDVNTDVCFPNVAAREPSRGLVLQPAVGPEQKRREARPTKQSNQVNLRSSVLSERLLSWQPRVFRSLFASLVGATIPTVTGRACRIDGVEGDKLIVATQKSSDGEPAALTATQAAADRVFNGGIVQIDPVSVGSRSAVIGAVLQAMPGVEVLRGARRA